MLIFVIRGLLIQGVINRIILRIILLPLMVLTLIFLWGKVVQIITGLPLLLCKGAKTQNN